MDNHVKTCQKNRVLFLTNQQMKLNELNPRWTGYGEGENQILTGITFDCPHCFKQRLGVSFWPPIDRAAWLQKGVQIPRSEKEWARTGETFDNITLSPSIDASARIDFNNHWHGHIKNGEVL